MVIEPCSSTGQVPACLPPSLANWVIRACIIIHCRCYCSPHLVHSMRLKEWVAEVSDRMNIGCNSYMSVDWSFRKGTHHNMFERSAWTPHSQCYLSRSNEFKLDCTYEASCLFVCFQGTQILYQRRQVLNEASKRCHRLIHLFARVLFDRAKNTS